LSKPAAAIYGAYGWSETYPATTWANPDDILLENWRTTDVAPGTYHLYAKNLDGTVYEDLGTHTFVAGKTTYVGPYPIYLPEVKANASDWTSYITIQNHSTTKAAQVNTTFFWPSGSWGYTHRTEMIPAQSSVTFSPVSGIPPFYGSAIVVASQDISVIVETRSGTGASLKTAGYAGLPAATTAAYLPTVGARTGEWSEIAVANTEGLAANVTIRFYNRSGNEMPNARQNLILNPHARSLTNLATLRDQGQLPVDFLGAAYIAADQPIVAEATTHFDAAPIVDTRHWRK